MASPRLQYLLVSPEQFTLRQSINPLSNASHSRVDHDLAAKEFNTLLVTLKKFRIPHTIIHPHAIDPTNTTPDIIYTANWGISLPTRQTPFIISKMKKTYRRPESPKVAAFLLRNFHTNMFHLPSQTIFEGTGLACWSHNYRHLWLGYGVRTSYSDAVTLRNTIRDIYRYYEQEPPTIHLLHIRNPWYDLDLAFLALPGGRLLYRPAAFMPHSLRALEAVFGTHKMIPFTFDNSPFALNAKIIEIRGASPILLCGTITDSAKEYIEGTTGLHVVSCPLTYAEKGGGSLRCCLLDYFTDESIKL
jgi:N-dimethylarginine dimethylaminohydrolase